MPIQKCGPREELVWCRTLCQGDDELQYRGQVIQAVLERCTCERPGPAARQQLALSANLRVAVLYLLRLVQDNCVPGDPSRRRLRIGGKILAERLVARQVDVGGRGPLPGSLGW